MNKKLKLKIVEWFGTQADFGQAIGEDDSFVSRIVRGRRVLSNKRKRVWADALNCKPEDIFK